MKPGHSQAFTNKFLGPYRIIKLHNDLNYILEDQAGKQRVVHYNRLAPFHCRDLTKWEVTKQVLDEEIQKTTGCQVALFNLSKSQFIFKKVTSRRRNVAKQLLIQGNQDHPPHVEDHPPHEANLRTSPIQFNEKEKETTKCSICLLRFEKIVGLRIHSYSCKGLTNQPTEADS